MSEQIILISDMLQREMLANILRQNGYIVQTYLADDIRALETISFENQCLIIVGPYVTLSDYVRNIVDGIKVSNTECDTPVGIIVIFHSVSEMEMDPDFFRYEFLDYIRFPIEIETLLLRMRLLLKRTGYIND